MRHFRFGGGQRPDPYQLGEPSLVDPRIPLRVSAECSVARQCMMPSQKDESCLRVRAEQAVRDGRDHGREADGQKLSGAVDQRPEARALKVAEIERGIERGCVHRDQQPQVPAVLALQRLRVAGRGHE